MEQRGFVLWILWGSLVTSLIVYLGIALAGVGLQSGEPSASGSWQLLAAILGVLAGGVAVGTFVLRSALLTRPVRAGVVDPSTPAGAQRIQTAYIVVWVLSEAVGIWGLVLWLLSASWSLFLPFLAGSALLLLLHAPRAANHTRPASLQDLASGHGTIG